MLINEKLWWWLMGSSQAQDGGPISFPIFVLFVCIGLGGGALLGS